MCENADGPILLLLSVVPYEGVSKPKLVNLSARDPGAVGGLHCIALYYVQRCASNEVEEPKGILSLLRRHLALRVDAFSAICDGRWMGEKKSDWTLRLK